MLDLKGAAAEGFEGLFIRDPFDKDEVAAAVLVARVEESVLERLFISEKEEPFRVHVEPPERETFWREVEFRQSPLVVRIRVLVELAEDSVGLVEGDEHLVECGWEDGIDKKSEVWEIPIMAEVRKLDSRRRVVFPDCFSPGDLFLEETVRADEVIFRRITPDDAPLAKVVTKNGRKIIKAPLDRKRLVNAMRADRDAR